MNILNLLSGEITQKELLNYYNATIIYEELPVQINGLVFDYDDVNFIIINKNLSYYKRKKTILHELAHIELNQLNQIDRDLFSFKIDNYEDAADVYIKFLIENVVKSNE
ncbi:MAG: ImmA/IrrE family metallo-endopeptidase [Bacilli bacterium]